VTHLVAQSADETTSQPTDCLGYSHLALYCSTGTGTPATGVVTWEEAATPDYAGVWAQIATQTTATATQAVVTHVDGAFAWVRSRITTVIGGGTVTTALVAS
jgi:hypothetical protein